MKHLLIFSLGFLTLINLQAREYHVSKKGKDSNPGTVKLPLLTIQAAANLAKPGDEVIVHQGIYREWIKPPRGGEPGASIVYKSAEGEKVEVRGSEIIKTWSRHQGNVWKTTISNEFFGNYNPYRETIHGDWFNDLGRVHHTGDVYLNEKSMWEVPSLDQVLNPVPVAESTDAEGSVYTWYCESDDANTILYANFHDYNPTEEQVEINVRQSCFYPAQTGINYITIRGFTMRHAATQWAPPTAEQIGLIGTNWSKGWVIENNVIRDSRCSGITLGKHGDEYDNTSEDSAEGYVETIHRAIERGWSKENIGSHTVRNNEISFCEQTGICGSLGAIFSTIEGNNIHDIWIKRQFTGAEMGGLKIHAAIDMLIKNNRFVNCGRGLWLDWMNQGARVTANLFYNNTTDDVFVEVNHGPYLFDNNMLLSDLSIRDWSEGGAWVHNLIAGSIELRPQDRLTPYHHPHSAELAGLVETRGGDNRYYNNIFTGSGNEVKGAVKGLAAYNQAELPVYASGNVYMNDAQPLRGEENAITPDQNSQIKISHKNGNQILEMIFPQEILDMKNQMIHTGMLGKAKIPGLMYENPDGTALQIDTDYYGKKRNLKNPVTGPFANPDAGKIKKKVW